MNTEIKEKSALDSYPVAATSVVRLPTDRIVPNPAQPRKNFSDRALASLADSVRRHGILQPLLVRRSAAGYELIAGERRLRAAIAAGLDKVPCIVRDTDAAASAELAIIENLQREDLDMFEEAEAIRSLIELCGMTQESAAAHLSCSQSYVANKLRLLRLPDAQRRRILDSGLTERHARTLLRIRDDQRRAEVLEELIARKMNVAAAEEYVEACVCEIERAESARRGERFDRDVKRRMLTRDMRLFYNSIDRAVESVRSCGIDVDVERTSEDGVTVIEIRLTT